MTAIPLTVQYCDDIIMHADNSKYSLIGIYPDVYPIPSEHCIIGKIAVAASFSVEHESLAELGNGTLKIEILKNNEIIAAIETPPLSQLPAPPQNATQFSFFFHQLINGLPVRDNDKLFVKMQTDTLRAETSPLVFIQSY